MPDSHRSVKKVIVLGGGSAGFMAALALKVKMPDLSITLIRSKDIGIIGVGEGSTVGLTRFLHQCINVSLKKFHETAQPTWKLGLKFIWGPRPHFFYTFGSKQPESRLEGMGRAIGFYANENETMEYDLPCALMEQDKAFEKAPGGGPVFPNDMAFAYHFENEKFVNFLESYAAALGIEIREDKVLEVKQDDSGITGLVLESGVTATADLYVDSSGFVSLLLGKTLGEPFISFKPSLFCDRAVVGGWTRGDEPIHPYTTCETMDSGWCWQIEHENRINRGYVYCSSFIGDDEAEREFRGKNPKVGPTRIVKFVTGCYPRAWVKNVVAIGNATGFVEPLEATALGVIATQSWLLADSLIDSDRMMLPTQMAAFNDYHLRSWSAIRACIAMHYKYNTRLDTPFWRECREKTDLAGAERVVEYYQQNGPSALHKVTLLDPHDQFQAGGYYTLLLGMKVPFRQRSLDTQESRRWEAFRQHNRQIAQKALTAREAMEMIRSPKWKWGSPQPGAGAGAASMFGGPGRG